MRESNSLDDTARSKSLNESSTEECYIFECFKESKKGLFSGGFLKFNLIIERLPEWGVWQVTVISEAYSPNLDPEEVFLLENVE